MQTPQTARQWLGTVLSMWRAMFLPWRVGFVGWIVAWILAVLGGLPGALIGIEVAGLAGPRSAPILLLIGLVLGAVLGSAAGDLIFTLPFLLGAMLHDARAAITGSRERPSAALPGTGYAATSQQRDDDRDSSLDPRAFATAPEDWQPQAERVAQAETVALPFELRQRQSPLRVLRMLVVASLPWLVIFEVTGLCDQGRQLLTLRGQTLALEGAVGFGIATGVVVYVLIVLMHSLKHDAVTASREGLTKRVNGRLRTVHWHDAYAWTVSRHREVPLGIYGTWRAYTLWTLAKDASEPYPSLTWNEYEGLALAGYPGLWGGVAAYRARADQLHALIVARTRLSLRLEPDHA